MERTLCPLDDWQQLIALLPDDRETLAEQSGALKRKRQVRDADTLLRLALAYSWLGFSLRNTAAWAHQNGVVELSDVAVLKQLRHAADYLQRLVFEILQQRTNLRQLQSCRFCVEIVDASVISEPGSTGTDWRLHLSFELNCLSITAVEITDASGAETFTRFCAAGKLVMGDRGYAHRQGIADVVAAGGHVLVRLNWLTVPLLHEAGAAFDLFGALDSLSEGQIGDWTVRTVPDAKKEIPSILGRLVAIAKSQASAEATRRQIRKQAQKKGKTPDARTLKAAGYIFVFTSVSAEDLSAAMVLELYRFRWQIELAFKRFKSLLGMGELQAHDPDVCRTYLYGKLLAALLIEDLSNRSAFSPWDLGNGSPAVVMALDTDALADAASSDWNPTFIGLPKSVGAGAQKVLRHTQKTS